MATSKLVLYKSKEFKDGSFPVLLRITIGRKPMYYNIGNNLKCKSEQWDEGKLAFNSKYPNYKKANRDLQKAYSESLDLLFDLFAENPNFSHKDFRNRFYHKTQRLYLFKYFDQIINRLKSAGKIGNALVYETTRNVFFSFLKGNDTLEIKDISIKTLRLFIEDCQTRGLKPNTINNYLRTLRALCNKAIKEEEYEYYPFKNFDWTNLKNKTIKRAISKDDILRIINYQAELGSYRFDAIKMFSFMYLTYGLNFADLAKMKEANLMILKDTYILTYNRSKGGKLYEIPLSEIPIEIINYYRSVNIETGYVFPVLHQDIHITPTQIKTRIKTALKKFNTEIKLVAQELMIPEKVTSYVSRHTFASVLAKEGESLYTISEMMGHSDLKTTQVYLKELDYSGKIAAGRKLLN